MAGPGPDDDDDGLEAPLPLGVPDALRPTDDEPLPEIAPPVLLEPIPAPRTPEGFTAEVPPSETEDDPYSWASEAAASMEREGRSFDTNPGMDAIRPTTDRRPSDDEIEDLEAFEDIEMVEVVHADRPKRPPSLAQLAAEAHDRAERYRTEERAAAPPPPARPAAAPRPSEQRPQAVVRPARQAPAPAPPPPARDPTRWAIAAVVFLMVGSGSALLGRALGGIPTMSSPILAPVRSLEDGTTSDRRFATPPGGEQARPPGSGLDFRPSDGTGPPNRTAPSTMGVVHLMSDPLGATVMIDSRTLGATPLDVQLPYGAYSIELDLDGYASVRRILSVSTPEDTFRANLVREVARGPVEVVAPGWEGANLTVDGTFRGTVPLSVQLAPGTHTFRIDSPDGTLEVDREVWVMQDRALRVDLTR